MKLPDSELERQLQQLPPWEHMRGRGGLLRRDFTFPDSTAAFGLMAQVAMHAERSNLHPEWCQFLDSLSRCMPYGEVFLSKQLETPQVAQLRGLQ
jgi:pterin-4a-carbinolamine dehydratase